MRKQYTPKVDGSLKEKSDKLTYTPPRVLTPQSILNEYAFYQRTEGDSIVVPTSDWSDWSNWSNWSQWQNWPHSR